jgi:hypothetical protein
VRLFLRATVSLLALAGSSVPAVALAAPATATSATNAGASAALVAPCLTSRIFQGDQQVPKWRRYADTTPVTEKDLQAVPRSETRISYVNREIRPQLASRITIPTYVHVIKGRHKGERDMPGPKRVRALMTTLNNGMAGKQSIYSTPLRYRFALKNIDYHKNERWYHAYLFGPRDTQMKRRLHRGNQRTLNIYINGGGPKGSPVLGWSRFPWQYHVTPKLDSISINVAAMRGGAAKGYNLGDTVIHETGHWLGLFHPFQGGCSTPNDMVADTPQEAQPSFGCLAGRDTCVDDPGLDPIHNFMDYSLDACMNKFTPGQAARVDTAWAKWRQ